MVRSVVVVLALVALYGPQSAAPPLLEPNVFKEIPKALRLELEKRGCRIPQTFVGGDPHNVVRGEFAKSGQVDFAALCWTGSTSEIIVQWGGPAQCASPLERRENSAYLSFHGKGEFYRQIYPANPETIRKYSEFFKTPIPPRLDHQGLADAYLEKGSTILYCQDGNWSQLQGAD